MRLYNTNNSLIPGEQPRLTDGSPSPTAVRAVPGKPQAQQPGLDQGAVHAVHGGFAVTSFGLESVITINDQLVPYWIDRARLLQVHHEAAGVSAWAAQLAEKSWLSDPVGAVRAVIAAIEHHYPGQRVIDYGATHDYALRKWARTRRRPGDDDELGYEYVPGEATLRALAAREAEADSERASAEAAVAVADLAWISAYPVEHHDVLRQHGVEPHIHPDAHLYNLRIIEAATAGGFAGDALARTADELARAYILEEEEEEDVPDEIDWIANDFGE